MNQNDETVGSVNVPTRQAGDLAKHWSTPPESPEQSDNQEFATKLRPKKMSAAIRKAMVLRGC